MLVYDGTKADFLRSVEQDTIAYEIEENIYNKMNRRTARNEFRAWENSLEYMYKVLNDSAIPDDSGMIIHMHLRTAGATQIFFTRVERAFKTEYISS